MLGLIEKAAEAGIILYVENGQLRYRQLGDEFPSSIKKQIKEEKENIIAYLTQKTTKKSVDGLQQKSSNILQQLEDSVQKTPNKTALVFENESLTYQKFSTQVEKLAKYIIHNADGKPVSLLLDRGINTMVAIYASLRANIAYVPIDPANPQERINYYLKDAKSHLLIGEPKYAHVSEHFNGKLAAINDVFAASEYSQVQLPEIADIDNNSPAYIIYTSGSTGEPKGVVCSHDNLIHFGKAMMQQFAELGLDNDAKWLWNASYAFDASIKAVVALAQGKTIVVPNELDVKDPKAIIKLIQEQNIPVVNTAPIVMEYLLPHLESTNTHVHIIVSGDDVDKQLWARLYEYSVSCNRKVINAYGPTEASVNASYELQLNNEDVSIGKAVIGAQLYVLDKNGQKISTGEEGELYIAGPSVALGYLNRDEATKSSFVILGGSQTRAFKTGDIVKHLSDGRLQFVGRIDDQVKYRGYRVELNEIKVTLKRYDGLSDVAVITRKEGGELRIEAYIVSGDIVPSVEDLTAHVNKYLPEYMHPTKFHYVDEIPLTSGGKIDKSRLVVPELTTNTKRGEKGKDVASRLTAIWLETLTLSEIKPDDNFFQLGGHSLLAMQLLQSIDLEFGVVMEIRELFSLLTLQSQIDWITENLSDLDIDMAFIAKASTSPSSANSIGAVLIDESNEEVELEI
jgi:amino acid adenylation domain-containing protein